MVTIKQIFTDFVPKGHSIRANANKEDEKPLYRNQYLMKDALEAAGVKGTPKVVTITVEIE